MIYKHEVNYCMTVKELKMFLIENNEVAFLEKDIGLIMQAKNKDLKQELELNDDSMPLHYFTSDPIIKLKVIAQPYLLHPKTLLAKLLVTKFQRKALFVI